MQQALPTISRNPFLPPKKIKEHGQLVATLCWHDLEKEASVVQDSGGVHTILYPEKKPLQLGKAEGLGG